MARNKPETAILIGIPGAGKTTYYVQQMLQTHVRLSLDMLRTGERQDALMRACLAAKQSFAIDNTNLTAADRAPYIAAAKSAGFAVSAYYFPPNVRRSIALNNKRTVKVPVYGILRAYKRVEPPTADEGFDALFSVEFGKDNAFALEAFITGH